MSYAFYTFDEVISSDLCDQIIELGKQSLEDGRIEDGALADTRKSKISFNVPEEAKKIVADHVIEANSRTFCFDISGRTTFQFTEYDAKYQGYYDWHSDCFFDELCRHERKLSSTTFLSDPDDYDGGVFKVGTFEIKPKKGTMIVFPSFLSHKVTEVTKGIRYSLVSWTEGLPFR